eukprot:UN22916
MLKLGDQERPYTPVSSDDDSGFFEIVVKIYPDGRLTPNLDKLEIGDYIEARGPVGMLQYKGRGLFVKRPKHYAKPLPPLGYQQHQSSRFLHRFLRSTSNSPSILCPLHSY